MFYLVSAKVPYYFLSLYQLNEFGILVQNLAALSKESFFFPLTLIN